MCHHCVADKPRMQWCSRENKPNYDRTALDCAWQALGGEKIKEKRVWNANSGRSHECFVSETRFVTMTFFFFLYIHGIHQTIHQPLMNKLRNYVYCSQFIFFASIKNLPLALTMRCITVLPLFKMLLCLLCLVGMVMYGWLNFRARST